MIRAARAGCLNWLAGVAPLTQRAQLKKKKILKFFLHFLLINDRDFFLFFILFLVFGKRLMFLVYKFYFLTVSYSHVVLSTATF